MAKVDGLEELEKEQGEAFVQEIKKQIGIILVNSLREMDIPFGDGNFGIILPQTTEEGAVVAARRIADSVNRKVRVALYIGVASFGSDALNDDELQKVAEAALNVAQTTNKTVVCYSQIRNATERTQSSVDVAL
jgi:GGDEF domain-containing protein